MPRLEQGGMCARNEGQLEVARNRAFRNRQGYEALEGNLGILRPSRLSGSVTDDVEKELPKNCLLERADMYIQLK